MYNTRHILPHDVLEELCNAKEPLERKPGAWPAPGQGILTVELILCAVAAAEGLLRWD